MNTRRFPEFQPIELRKELLRTTKLMLALHTEPAGRDVDKQRTFNCASARMSAPPIVAAHSTSPCPLSRAASHIWSRFEKLALPPPRLCTA